MPEPTNSTSSDAAELAALRTEVATLRTTNNELKQKSATRKQRIKELEAALSQKDIDLADASKALRQVTIDGPLKDMSESISNCGELWLEQFNKAYRLEMKDGALTLLTSDGKPLQHEGAAVPFERDALAKFLTHEKHPQSKAFRAITIANRASGSQGNSAPPQRKPGTAQKPNFQFGNPPRPS